MELQQAINELIELGKKNGGSVTTNDVAKYFTEDKDEYDKIEKAFKEQNVEVNLNANTSEETIEVYNLCGQLVANQLDKLPKGVYIVKQDGTSRKVVIR